MARRWLPSPAVRRNLATYQTGVGLGSYWSATSALGCRSDTIQKLIKEGYLVQDNPNFDWWRAQLIRTSKPVSYKPRPHLRKPPDPAKWAPFPWSVGEHRRLNQNSQLAVSLNIARQLGADTRVMHTHHEWYFGRYRKCIKTLFEEGNTSSLHGSVDRHYREWAQQSPLHTRLLMLELLIEAEFEDGKFVRFVPMQDGDHVVEEWHRLNNLIETGNHRERYQRWMEESNGTADRGGSEAGEGVHHADHGASVLCDTAAQTA